MMPKPDLKTDSDPAVKWVLLVEDSEDLLSVLTEALLRQGMRVVQAKTVVGAITKLSRQKFAVLVVDIRLAQGLGTQIIDYVKKSTHAINSKIPILVISGFVDRKLVEEVRSKTNGILVKPFKLSAFIDKINQFIKNK